MKVVSIGADVDEDLSPGDKVVASKYAGTDVKLEDGTIQSSARVTFSVFSRIDKPL